MAPAERGIRRQRLISCPGPARALEADDAAETREPVRGLAKAIRPISEEGPLPIEVRGALGAILRLAKTAGGAHHGKRSGVGAKALVEQVKMDAGTGRHRQLPVRLRA